MANKEMIPATEFCIHHNIELSFIYAVNESELIEIINIDEEIFLPTSQLQQLEKLVRLHHEMGINLEGIETINYLLQKNTELQEQIMYLNNKIKLYEDFD